MTSALDQRAGAGHAGNSRRYATSAWRALGTYVNLVVADADRLDAARGLVDGVLARIDSSCSRFRTDSDLSRANRAPGRWVDVDPLLVQVVRAAVQVAEGTGGLVDPALGHRVVALGYDRDFAALPTRLPAGCADEAPAGGADEAPAGGPSGLPAPEPSDGAWRRIGLDPAGRLRVPSGAALDLGAIGKAFTADLVAASVPDRAGTALVVSIGGDVAVGPLEGDVAHPWRVAVAERPDDAVGGELVVLRSGGLATSSTTARRWSVAGTPVHHLVDPRTGLPAAGPWRTVSVCAGTCVDANAASTAAIVRGADAPAWLAGRGLAARLVDADGWTARVGGWPEPL